MSAKDSQDYANHALEVLCHAVYIAVDTADNVLVDGCPVKGRIEALSRVYGVLAEGLKEIEDRRAA